MKHLFNPGDIVYAKRVPHVKLIVRRYEDEVYHCKVCNHPENRIQIHYEKDLIGSSNPADKRHF